MSDTLASYIIQTAMTKMRQVGIRSVSIDDVCHELGISKKTFYVYFATKDELVEAILLQLEKEVNAHIVEQLEKKSILDLLLNFQKIARETRDVRKVPPLFYDLEKYYPSLYQAHRERSCRYAITNIRTALTRGVEERLFRADLDIEKASTMIMLLRETALNMPIEKREDKKTMEVFRYTLDVVMRGMVSAEGIKMIKQYEKIN